MLKPGGQSVRYRGESVRFFVVEKPVGQTSVRVAIGQTQASLFQRVSEIAALSAIGALGVFFVVALAVFAALQGALKPLRRIETSLQRRTGEDFSPLSSDVPAEVGTLVRSLNDSLASHKDLLDQTRGFIAESTHQIKTPIASLSAEADLLARDVPDPIKPRVTALAKHARRTSHLVNQLLTQASLTYRQGLDRRQATDLSELIDSVIESFDVLAEQKDIEIRSVARPGVVVDIDPIGLREAMVCLIDNALNHAGQLVDVVVDLQLTGEHVALSISDNGVGFKGDPSNWLQAFESGDGSSGAGLGLSIAQRVAESMGGWLALENPVEGGAKCTLYWPR